MRIWRTIFLLLPLRHPFREKTKWHRRLRRGMIWIDRTAGIWHTRISEILKLAQIAQVLPVTNAEVERSFSTLGDIETKKRVNLSDERMDRLLKIAAEGRRLFPIEPWKIYNFSPNRQMSTELTKRSGLCGRRNESSGGRTRKLKRKLKRRKKRRRKRRFDGLAVI